MDRCEYCKHLLTSHEIDEESEFPYSICSECNVEHLKKGYQEDIGICLYPTKSPNAHLGAVEE